MRAGIALGSNLGDRLSNLRVAVRRILELAQGSHLLAAAPVYETDPVDCPPGSLSFYNSVIEIATRLEPHDLHRVLQGIEEEMGRPKDRVWHAPRPIDLDVLYCDDQTINDAVLVVPHPRLHVRRFVLQPLVDLRPELKLPGHGRTVRQYVEDLADDPNAVRRIDELDDGTLTR